MLLTALFGALERAGAQERALHALVIPEGVSLRCEVLPPAADSTDTRVPALKLQFTVGEMFEERTITVSYDSSGAEIRLEDVSWTVSPQLVEIFTMVQAFFDPATSTGGGVRAHVGAEEGRRFRAAPDSAARERAAKAMEALLTDEELARARRLARWLHARRCTRET